MTFLILLLVASGGMQILTEKDVLHAFAAPINEEQAQLATKDQPTDLFVLLRRAKVRECATEQDRSVTCSIKVKWPRGGWHPKRSTFRRRADGTWIADEASRKALYD